MFIAWPQTGLIAIKIQLFPLYAPGFAQKLDALMVWQFLNPFASMAVEIPILGNPAREATHNSLFGSRCHIADKPSCATLSAISIFH